jgi:hypothetical protein
VELTNLVWENVLEGEKYIDSENEFDKENDCE